MTLFTSNFRPLWLRLLVVLALFLVANRFAAGPYRRQVVDVAQVTRQSLIGASQSWIVLGDSHAAVINFRTEGGLSLAEAGDSFAEMRIKLALARSYMANLKGVVITVDSHGFSTDRDRRNNRQKGAVLSNSASYQAVYGGGRLEYWKSTSLYSRLPLLNPVNARLTRRYLFHRWGWAEEQPVNWAVISQAERQQRAKQRFLENYGSGRSENQHRQFQALKSDVQEANLKLVLVRYPESPSMRAMARDLAWVKTLESELSSLEIHDFSNSFNDEKDYRDQDHLLPGSQAAVVLAKSVAEEMNR